MENNTLLCIKHYALILAAFWLSPLSGELEGSAFAQTNMSEKTLQEVVVTGTTKSTQTIEEQGVSYTLLDSAFISKNNVHDLSHHRTCHSAYGGSLIAMQLGIDAD